MCIKYDLFFSTVTVLVKCFELFISASTVYWNLESSHYIVYRHFLVYRLMYVWFSLSQEASAAIVGVGVFGKLKFESGIHRVQVFVAASHIKFMYTFLSTIST